MSSQTLYRLSGFSLLCGGLLAAISSLIQGFLNNNPLNPLWVVVAVTLLIGVMVVLLGLPGMYARQASQAGIAGLVGFILFFFAVLMLGIGGGTLSLLIFPWLVTAAPALAAGPPALEVFFIPAGLLVLVGGTLLGVGTIRAGIFSRAAGFLLIISTVLNFAGQFVSLPYFSLNNITETLVFLALAWLGYGLLALRSVEASPLAQTTPASGVHA
jgi:hypothetical protein